MKRSIGFVVPSKIQLLRLSAIGVSALALVGSAVVLPGCTTQQRRQYLEDQWELLKREIDKAYREDVEHCNGDETCEDEAWDRRREALDKLREWYQAEVSKELDRSREAERDWDEWIQRLPDEIKKIWEGVREFIDLIRSRSSIYTEGQIETRQVIGGPVAVAAPGEPEQEVVSAPDAVTMVVDSATAAGGFVPVDLSRRLVTAGSFEFEDPDSGVTLNYSVSTSIKLGAPETSSAGTVYRITGGSLQLTRQGTTTDVRVRMGLEGEGLYLNTDGSGLLRFYAEPIFASQDDDILLGERMRMEIPVEHAGAGSVRLTSHGDVPFGYLGEWHPDPISDANGDGLYDAADEAAFLSRHAAGDAMTDLNLDGLFDAADIVLFTQIHAEDLARSQFNASR